MRGGPVLVLLAAALSGTCAAPRLELPSGDGDAFPGYEQAWDEAASACRGVRSLSAEVAVSGRAGSERLRGHLIAGFATPGRIRLEAAAPFGPPLFILVASGSTATLLLPRDHQVLLGEPASAILDALVGLNLGPDDLLAILAGCVVTTPRATGGRSFSAGWARIDLGGAAAAYLKSEGSRWTVRAGVRPGLLIGYGPPGDHAPSSVRLQVAAADGSLRSDVRLGLSQVETGVELGPEVFAVKVPADAVPMTLADLRQAAPVGEKR